MNTNENTTQGGRFRNLVRYVWSDQVRAHRALLDYPPYDDYLLYRRSGR
jgi:hypothetical protein